MTKLKGNICPLLLLLFMPLMSYIYTIANQQNTITHDLTTILDNNIPFLKIFVLPYMFWHIFIPLVFIILCFMDKKTYFKTMLIYVAGCLISNLVFILYQTTIARAIPVGNDIFTNMVKIIYANDNPVNCFPSIHVFTSFLMIRAVAQSTFSNFYYNLSTSIIGFLIIFSTLFVKQHGILDVFSGILLAEILVRTVNYNEARLLVFWNKKLFFRLSLEDIFNLNIVTTAEDDYTI